MLYETKCESCGGQWVSPEDDAIYCDPCVVAGYANEREGK